MSLHEFTNSYKKYGKCPNDLGRREKPLNDRQVEMRYKAYLRSVERKKEHAERKKPSVFHEKRTICEISRILSFKELQLLKQNAGPLYQIVDGAHIFGRGPYPWMKDDDENIVGMNRYSHSCLDQTRHPVTGQQITEEERFLWWALIVGPELWKELCTKARRLDLIPEEQMS